MKRGHLYIVIIVVAVVIGGLGYYFYQEEQRTKIDIEIGDGGVSVETD